MFAYRLLQYYSPTGVGPITGAASNSMIVLHFHARHRSAPQSIWIRIRVVFGMLTIAGVGLVLKPPSSSPIPPHLVQYSISQLATSSQCTAECESS